MKREVINAAPGRTPADLIRELDASRSALAKHHGGAVRAVSLCVGFQTSTVMIAVDHPDRLADLTEEIGRGGSPIAIFGLVASAAPGEVVLYWKVLREYEGAPWVKDWLEDVRAGILQGSGGRLVRIEGREWMN